MRHFKYFRYLVIALIGLIWLPSATANSQSGVISALQGQGSLFRGQQEISLAPSLPIFHQDRIVTNEGAKVQILLKDQSSFSIGESAEITIDEFVYDPGSKKGHVLTKIGKGAFRFVSGKIAKKDPDNMRVQAGDVVIAVRGTEVIGRVDAIESNVILLSGAIDVMSLSAECITQSTGGGGTFEIDQDGRLKMNAVPKANAPTRCSGSIAKPGFAVQINTAGLISEPLRVTPDEVEVIIKDLKVNESQNSTDSEQAEQPPAENEPTEDQQIQQDQNETGEESTSSSENNDSDSQQSVAERTTSDKTQNEFPSDDQSVEESEKTDELLGEQNPAINSNSLSPSNEVSQTINSTSAARTRKEEDALQEKVGFDELFVSSILGEREITKASDPIKGVDLTSQIEIKALDPAGKASEQNQPKEIETTTQSATETTEKLDTVASNRKPTLKLSNANLAYDDTPEDDSLKVETIRAEGQDVESSMLEYFVIVNGVARSSASGSFGSLRVDKTTGEISFEPDDSAIEALKVDDIGVDAFTIQVVDIEGASSEQTLQVTVKGADDKPSFKLASNSLSFADTSKDDSFSTTTEIASTVFRDATNRGDSLTFTLYDGSKDVSSIDGTYGKLSIDSDGKYTFAPDDNAIESLTKDASETFTVRALTSDGDILEKTLTININGSDDEPEISLASSQFEFNDTSSSGDSFSSESSRVSIIDRDTAGSYTYSLVDGSTEKSSVTGSYGTLSINSSGTYTYSPNDSAIDSESTDKSESFKIRITSATGEVTEETLIVKINGVTEAPPPAVDTPASFASPNPNPIGASTKLEYSYTIVATDPDGTPSITAANVPLGMTLTDNGDGTATLAGVPWIAGTASSNIDITATGDQGDTITQSASVTVNGSTGPGYAQSTDPLAYLVLSYDTDGVGPNVGKITDTSAGGQSYKEFDTWQSMWSQLSAKGFTGSGAIGFSRYGSELLTADVGASSWGTVNVQYLFNPDEKTMTATVWGSFDNYLGEQGFFSGTVTEAFEANEYVDHCFGSQSISSVGAKCNLIIQGDDLRVCSSTTDGWCETDESSAPEYANFSDLQIRANVRLAQGITDDTKFVALAKIDVKTSTNTWVANTTGNPPSEPTLQLQPSLLDDVSIKSTAAARELAEKTVAADEQEYKADFTLNAGAGNTISATALPSWATLTDNGDGTASLETKVNSTARTGSYTLGLVVTDASGNTETENVTIVISCGSYRCGEFVGSTDTVTAPTFTDDPGAELDQSFKPDVNGVRMKYLTAAEYAKLFHAGGGTGVFQQTWEPTLSANATNGGAGQLTLNQKLVVDYASETGEGYLTGSFSNLDTGNLGLTSGTGTFSAATGGDLAVYDFTSTDGGINTQIFENRATITDSNGNTLAINPAVGFLEPFTAGASEKAVFGKVTISSGGKVWTDAAPVVLEPK